MARHSDEVEIHQMEMFVPICHPITHINQQIAKEYPFAFDFQPIRWKFANTEKWFNQFRCLPTNTRIVVRFQVWYTEAQQEKYLVAVGEVSP